ncbi:hypothetical protein AAC387_Pa01g1769 [Persea americana]
MFQARLSKTMEVYIDNMVVKSKRSQDHLADLSQTFGILRQFQLKLNASKCAFGVGSGKFLGSLVTRREIETNPNQILAIQELLRESSKFQWTPKCNGALQELKHYLSSPPLLSTPMQGEVLYLYLQVSDHAVSSVLIREENRQQRPIYYTSKILFDAETRYLQLEKLAPALVSASRKLSHCFQTYTIVVVTEHPLKSLFRKADFSRRISRWAVELGQYDIKYQPRTAIKAQVLADFIVEFISPSSASNQLDTELWGNKDKEEVTETEQERSWKQFLDLAWKVFVDGSSTFKRAGASIVLQSPEGLVIEQALTLGFKASNNEVEYEALIARLNSAKILEAWQLVVFSDSQLVTSQLSGDYQARDERMAAYLTHAKQLLSQFERAESNRSAESPILMLMPSPTSLLLLKPRIRELSRLYRKSYTGPYLQCVHPSKVEDFLYEIHEGICESHIGGWTLAYRAISQVCGPSLNGAWILYDHSTELQGIRGGYYYFTKWIEVEPLSSITEQDTKNFVWKNIITRFGIPRTLVSNNGTQFDSNFFRNFCQELDVRNVYSTPVYPQSNGQAEISNKVVLDGLKQRLDRAKGRWTEELPSILWAYRTTPRRSTSATLFSLAYGMEAVIPLEVGLSTFRSELYN